MQIVRRFLEYVGLIARTASATTASARSDDGAGTFHLVWSLLRTGDAGEAQMAITHGLAGAPLPSLTNALDVTDNVVGFSILAVGASYVTIGTPTISQVIGAATECRLHLVYHSLIA